MAAILGPVSPSAEAVADRLINKYGSLSAVFDAALIPNRLPVPAAEESWLALLSEALRHSLRWRLPAQAPVRSWTELLDYLTFTQAHGRTERVRVIYLDIKNRLLSDDVIAEGTVDAAPFSVRDIIERGLGLNAGAMVLVHNHPSGDPTPSRADKEVTRRLASVGRECGIDLLDHIIVAKGNVASFRALGLI